mgnify:FL=1
MTKVKDDTVKVNLSKPGNLNLEELIKPESKYFVSVRRNDGSSYWDVINGEKLSKYIPAMYYFIHVLLQRQHISYDTLRLRYDKSFVRVFARDIEPVKSKNYFNLIVYKLITLKVIEKKTSRESTKHGYVVEGQYFRLTEEYLNAVVIQHEITLKKTTAEKLNVKIGIKSNDSRDTASISSFKQIPAIYHQYLAVQNIKFNAVGAEEYLTRSYADKTIEIGRLNTCRIFMYNIVNRRFYYTYSDACERFFTTVNGMPKELRQFILDGDNKGLAELDFGSSTAYVIYKIISSDMPEHSSVADKILFETEVNLYKRLLETGDFYTAIKDIVFNDLELSRDQIKEIVIKHWFNTSPGSKNKYRKQFCKLFPRITEFMDSKKSPTYEDFFNFVMLLESKLVNGIIYQKFINLHPDAVIYTIFDSFLIDQKYSDELFELMLNEGRKFYNVDCVVKKKNYATPKDDTVIVH